MKLSELFLNRFLYKEFQQDIETKDSVYDAMNNIPAPVPPLAAGGAAQDINTSNVFINGAQIEPGTIPTTVLDVSNWGWTQTCIFTSLNGSTVQWSLGNFISANGISYAISVGNTGTMGAGVKTYIYLDLNVSSTAYQHTAVPGDAVGIGKVLIAVANPSTSGNATWNLNVATQIVSDNILANSINASKITAGSITATQISSGYIYAGTILANQITAGTLTGFTIRTAASGARVQMDSTNYIQGYDSSYKRFELDTKSLSYYDENGIFVGSIQGGIDGSGTLYDWLWIYVSQGVTLQGGPLIVGSDVNAYSFTLNSVTITDWSDIGGSQTPWTSDVDAAGYKLTGLGKFKLPVGTNLY